MTWDDDWELEMKMDAEEEPDPEEEGPVSDSGDFDEYDLEQGYDPYSGGADPEELYYPEDDDYYWDPD